MWLPDLSTPQQVYKARVFGVGSQGLPISDRADRTDSADSLSSDRTAKLGELDLPGMSLSLGLATIHYKPSYIGTYCPIFTPIPGSGPNRMTSARFAIGYRSSCMHTSGRQRPGVCRYLLYINIVIFADIERPLRTKLQWKIFHIKSWWGHGLH